MEEREDEEVKPQKSFGELLKENPVDVLNTMLKSALENENLKQKKALVERLKDVIENEEKIGTAFNAYKEKQSAMLNNLLSNPQTYFASEHAKFMNQKNPRFIGLFPMEKDWENTDYKKAYDIYKEKFSNAGNFHFYFVGNIDESKFKN